jgi:hypothetical protein
VAEHDQQVSSGRENAARLLSAYITFQSAMDAGNLFAASMFHEKYMKAYQEMDAETLFLAVSILCDWIHNELLATHGGWEGLLAAVKEGRLFKSGANMDQEEGDLLRRLDKDMNPHG